MSTYLSNNKLPNDALLVTTYQELGQYLQSFAGDHFDLLMLLGRQGTGKTKSVRDVLCVEDDQDEELNPWLQPEEDAGASVLFVTGKATAWGLYQELYRFRNCPVVLDDLDAIYANVECIRLLKALTDTASVKRISWVTASTGNGSGTPRSFTTTSPVLLIGNEWNTINENIRALEDRALIVFFDPPPLEVHRQVAKWFDDEGVFNFIAQHLPYIPALSMRYYVRGRALRRAGHDDWQGRLLEMMLPDRNVALVASVQLDPRFGCDAHRVRAFRQKTGLSRATYYRIKQQLPQPIEPPSIRLGQPHTAEATQ